jgi:hypothetical protein
MAVSRSITWALQTRYLYTIFLASSLITPVTPDGSVTITNEPYYSLLRPCAQQCMWCGQYWLQNCPALGINNILTCGLDSCYCRTDLQSSALSYITSCVLSGCSGDSVDLTQGLSLYSGYCSIDGATLDNYPAATSTLPAGTTTLAASPGTGPTVLVVSTDIPYYSSSIRTAVTSEWVLILPVAAAVAVAVAFINSMNLLGA